MGAASAVKTAPRIPPLLTWCRWCQRSHYDCSLVFILQKHLCLRSISSVALYSHVLLHQTCLLLYSTLQLRDTKLPKTTPGKKHQLSVTFIPLFFFFFSFLRSLHRSSRSPAACFSILCPLPHIIISSHSRRKMISSLPMPLRLKFSRMWSDFSVEVARGVGGCDSDDSCWCQHELAICVAMWQWEIGYFLNAQWGKITLTRVGLSEAFWWISNERNQCGKRIPLVVLKASLYFCNIEGTDLRSSAGQHSLLRSW